MIFRSFSADIFRSCYLGSLFGYAFFIFVFAISRKAIVKVIVDRSVDSEW